ELGRGLRAREQEHRTNDRLDGVGEQRFFLTAPAAGFANTEAQIRPNVDRPGDLRERNARYQGSTAPRELALRKFREISIELHRHGLPENGVAEKLEAFVMGRPAVFERP